MTNNDTHKTVETAVGGRVPGGKTLYRTTHKASKKSRLGIFTLPGLIDFIQGTGPNRRKK